MVKKVVFFKNIKLKPRLCVSGSGYSTIRDYVFKLKYVTNYETKVVCYQTYLRLNREICLSGSLGVGGVQKKVLKKGCIYEKCKNYFGRIMCG